MRWCDGRFILTMHVFSVLGGEALLLATSPIVFFSYTTCFLIVTPAFSPSRLIDGTSETRGDYCATILPSGNAG
jgi:hypothetical protein